MEQRFLFSHAEIERMLRKAGYSHELIDDVLSELPDPIDTDRDGATFFKHGISLGGLIDRMGGSP